jgi:hypothetical protein
MGNFEQDQQADDIGIKAVFNKDDIDTQKLWHIDNVKTNFLLGFNDLDAKSAGDQLTNLLSAELDIMTKYFSEEEIKKQVRDVGILKAQNFYDLKAFSETNYDDDLDAIRLICEKTGEIYNFFARLIGNELPMGKTDFLGK